MGYKNCGLHEFLFASCVVVGSIGLIAFGTHYLLFRLLCISGSYPFTERLTEASEVTWRSFELSCDLVRPSRYLCGDSAGLFVRLAVLVKLVVPACGFPFASCGSCEDYFLMLFYSFSALTLLLSVFRLVFLTFLSTTFLVKFSLEYLFDFVFSLLGHELD